MKKLVFALIAACGFATANAQQPHSFLLYGNVGLSSATDSGSNKALNYNINPGVGYQFNENWTVGLNLGWSQNTSTPNATSVTTANNRYSLGAFARYHRYIGESNFFWFGQLNAGYHGGYSTSGSLPTYGQFTGLYANVMPALGLNFKKNWAINFSFGGVGVQTMKYDGAANGATNFNVSFGQQANFGLSKNFGCGHKMHHREPNAEMRDEVREDDAPKKSRHTKTKKVKVYEDEDE